MFSLDAASSNNKVTFFFGNRPHSESTIKSYIARAQIVARKSLVRLLDMGLSLKVQVPFAPRIEELINDHDINPTICKPRCAWNYTSLRFPNPRGEHSSYVACQALLDLLITYSHQGLRALERCALIRPKKTANPRSSLLGQGSRACPPRNSDPLPSAGQKAGPVLNARPLGTLQSARQTQ